MESIGDVFTAAALDTPHELLIPVVYARKECRESIGKHSEIFPPKVRFTIEATRRIENYANGAERSNW